jgi:hypothetical protein
MSALFIIIIIIHCLTSDMDPIRPTQTTLYTGETYKFTGRKPLICWGRKNPISHLSRMKNPELPCLHVAAALRAYSYVLLLGCFELLRNHCFLL